MFPTRQVLSAAALVLLLFGAAAKALGVVWIPVWPRIEAQALPALVEPARAQRRCPHCGWIESKREVAPRLYEYTVRMRDGSSSVFEEALPASWREGERLMIIN